MSSLSLTATHSHRRYLRYFRTSILSMTNEEDFERFFRQQNAIDANKFVKLIFKLRRDTPYDVLSPFLNSPSRALGAGAAGGGAVGTPVGAALASLPVGEYPVFNRYPKFVVDFQAQEHARVKEEELELERKRAMMEAVQRRAIDLEREEREWRIYQERLLSAEAERRREAQGQQARRDQDRRRIESQARARRLEQLAKMEEAAHRGLELQKKMREAESQRLGDELERQKQREDTKVQSKLEEETLLNLEFQATQRVLELQAQRKLEQEAAGLRAEVTLKQQQLDLEEQLAAENRTKEDQERALALELHLKRNQRALELNEVLQASVLSTSWPLPPHPL